MNKTNPMTESLLKAIHFAAHKHRDQRRKNVAKTPYINHPIDVAYLLLFEGGIRDLAVLQTAVLHDTVEDTQTTFAEIDSVFGPEVRQLIVEVTDDKTLTWSERKSRQFEKALNASTKARLVILADKICNLRDIFSDPPANWSTARQQTYFQWAKRVIAGIRGVHPKLEILFDRIQDAFHERHGTPSS